MSKLSFHFGTFCFLFDVLQKTTIAEIAIKPLQYTPTKSNKSRSKECETSEVFDFNLKFVTCLIETFCYIFSGFLYVKRGEKMAFLCHSKTKCKRNYRQEKRTRGCCFAIVCIPRNLQYKIRVLSHVASNRTLEN